MGASEERLMLSGMHTVADVYCCSCGQIVGWKYVLFYPSLGYPSYTLPHSPPDLKHYKFDCIHRLLPLEEFLTFKGFYTFSSSTILLITKLVIAILILE